MRASPFFELSPYDSVIGDIGLHFTAEPWLADSAAQSGDLKLVRELGGVFSVSGRGVSTAVPNGLKLSLVKGEARTRTVGAERSD